MQNSIETWQIELDERSWYTAIFREAKE